MASDDKTVVIIIAVALSVSVVAVCGLAAWYWYKKNNRRSGYRKTSDGGVHDIVEITCPHEPEEDSVSQNGHYDTAAPTVSVARQTSKGFQPVAGEDEETLMDDEHYEIYQWFKDNVRSIDENDLEEYASLFIDNGYVTCSSFRYITKEGLSQMGIDRRSHQTEILKAIQRQQSRNINIR